MFQRVLRVSLILMLVVAQQDPSTLFPTPLPTIPTSPAQLATQPFAPQVQQPQEPYSSVPPPWMPQPAQQAQPAPTAPLANMPPQNPSFVPVYNQYPTSGTPEVPAATDPIPEMLFVGINRTISQFSKETVRYSMLITDYKVQNILFFVVSPFNNVSWEQTSIKLSKAYNGTLQALNQCQDVGINVCFLPSTYFKSEDIVFADVTCDSDETCIFTLQTYWSVAYPLYIGKPLTMDFEQNAYAKLFSIDMNTANYREIRVLVTPKTVLESDIPISLYGNFGIILPSKQKHDFKGVHLWDDGLGIFITRQNMKETKLTIIVQGPPSNIVQIQAKVITDFAKEVKLNTMEYDYLGSQQSRTYYLTLPKNKLDINIKLSTFTGKVEVAFYKDENATQSFMSGQFQQFGDRLYRLPFAHLESNNITGNIYFKVHSGHIPSTFVLRVSVGSSKAIRLSTDISDMAEITQGEIANYYVNTYIQASTNESKFLKFNLHSIVGTNVPHFRVCHQAKESDCFVDYKTYMANKSAYDGIKPASVASAGNNGIYSIVMEPSQFVLDTHSKRFKKCTISVIIAQETEDRYLYGIEYQDESVVKTLREGTPIKDRLTIGSRKLYKIAALSKDVIAVHIHLVDISGTVLMFGSKTDPRGSEFLGDKLDIPIKNQLSYQTSNLTTNHTLYIIVQGQENSLFSLSVTFRRAIQLSQSAQFRDKFNFLAVSENVQQQITIQPYSYQVVQLTTNFVVHELSYTSAFNLQLCARTNGDKLPKDPNCDIKINSTHQELPASKMYFVGIGNPSNKTAQITLKYTSVFQCEEKNLGGVWNKYFQDSTASKCVKYSIHRNQSVEIVTSLDTFTYPEKYSDVYINEFKIQVSTSSFNLDHKTIAEHCVSEYCSIVVVIQNLTKTNVQLLVQYIGQETGLLDGISQEVFTVASSNDYKNFKFWLPNKNELNVILESKQGYFEFFINIKDEFEGHLNGKGVYPTRTAAMFKSTNPYYTLYNTLTLKEQQLKSINCTSCVAYISVVGIEESVVERGRFIIQASQERRVLKALTLTPGYLSKLSMAYYEYQFKKEQGSLVVSVSTQNTNCASTYVQKGNSKASPQSNIIKSYGGETVVPAKKGVYSITIEASQDCKYTISVSEALVKISEIKQGVYKDLRLKKDQVAYLYYRHLTHNSFKVLSMEDYGEVRISVTTINRSSIEGLENITSFDDKMLKDFHWPGSKDVVRVSQSDKGYCVECYYLIVIKGLKKTWTSIMLYTSNIDIPLTTGDEITDILNDKEEMSYKMYTQATKNVNISVFVYYGEIEVEIIGNTDSIKVFQKSNETVKWTVTIDKNLKELFLPTHFRVRAKQNSLYRLSIAAESSSFSQLNHKHSMKFGYPSYLFLSANQTTCAEVNIIEKDQRLMVSSSRNDKSKFQSLQVTVKAGNVSISGIKNEIIESTMIITLPNEPQHFPDQKTLVSYCFTSAQYISITLIPTDTITYFPENSVVLVDKQQNLTLNPQGKIFLQVFQCQGNAHVLLSQEFIKLKGGVTELAHWRKFGPNFLIQLEHRGPLYLNVDGPKTLVRWQHVNAAKGQGMGYYYYRTPHYTYDRTDQEVKVTVPPLIQTNQPKNYTIQGVNYTLIASDSPNTLKSATQCGIGKVITMNKFVGGSKFNQTVQLSIATSQLAERFAQSNYVFVSVVAEVTVLTSSNLTQTYRFIYQYQQIANKVVPQLQKQTEQRRYGAWFWGLWGGTLLVVGIYFLSKIVRAKIRQRHMMLATGTDVQIREVQGLN